MANILLGVSAGIAIYKSADLASRLTQRSHRVRTVMTPHALRFMTPLTFRAVTGEPVFTDPFRDEISGDIAHISLGQWGDLLLIAPATADLIGKLAGGLGDNQLTATALAFSGPVLLAPAMNDRMWAHPIVQDNLRRLREVVGYRQVGPEAGHLACGTTGVGRMSDVAAIITAAEEILGATPRDSDPPTRSGSAS